MIFSLRTCLVIFLVLLQCIAPLVHAHTGENFSSQGLHIPGLEVYGYSASVADATQSAPVLACKMSTFCSDMDGQVVGVDAGFSRDLALPIQHLHKAIADLHHDYSAILPPAVFNPPPAAFTTALHIAAVPLVSQSAYSAHPARAPPVHV